MDPLFPFGKNFTDIKLLDEENDIKMNKENDIKIFNSDISNEQFDTYLKCISEENLKLLVNEFFKLVPIFKIETSKQKIDKFIESIKKYQIELDNIIPLGILPKFNIDLIIYIIKKINGIVVNDKFVASAIGQFRTCENKEKYIELIECICEKSSKGETHLKELLNIKEKKEKKKKEDIYSLASHGIIRKALMDFDNINIDTFVLLFECINNKTTINLNKIIEEVGFCGIKSDKFKKFVKKLAAYGIEYIEDDDDFDKEFNDDELIETFDIL